MSHAKFLSDRKFLRTLDDQYRRRQVVDQCSFWKERSPMYKYRTCNQNRLLYTLHREKNRQTNAKQKYFLGCKNIGITNVFFYNMKDQFYFNWYNKKSH